MAGKFHTVALPLASSLWPTLEFPAQNPTTERTVTLDCTAFLADAGTTLLRAVVARDSTLNSGTNVSDANTVTVTISGGNAGTVPVIAFSLYLANGDRENVNVAVPINALSPAQSAPVVVPAIGLAAIDGGMFGAPIAVSGGLTNYDAIPALTYALDGGAAQPLPAGAVVSMLDFSFALTGIAAGDHSLVIGDGTGDASPAGAFTVAAAPALVILADPVIPAVVGHEMTFSGSYTVAAPAGYTYAWSNNGGAGTVSDYGVDIGGPGNWAVNVPASLVVDPAAVLTVTGTGPNTGSAASAPVPTTAAVARVVGPALVLSNPVFDTGKFGQALSGGGGLTADPIVFAAAGTSRTYEAWFKAASLPPGPVVILTAGAGGNPNEGLYLNTAGAAAGSFGYNIQGTTNVCDGAWHHIALVLLSNIGALLFIDGALDGTVPNGPYSIAYSATVGVRLPEYGFAQFGEMDEAAIFDYAKYLAPFTPPTTPYAADEPNLIACWPLDGDGTSL